MTCDCHLDSLRHIGAHCPIKRDFGIVNFCLWHHYFVLYCWSDCTTKVKSTSHHHGRRSSTQAAPQEQREKTERSGMYACQPPSSSTKLSLIVKQLKIQKPMHSPTQVAFKSSMLARTISKRSVSMPHSLIACPKRRRRWSLVWSDLRG